MLCNYCQEITAWMGGSGSIVLRLKLRYPLWPIHDPGGHPQPGWPLCQVRARDPRWEGTPLGRVEWLLRGEAMPAC